MRITSSDGVTQHQKERRYQRRYAKRHGYFWKPCPLCGEPFGGHEANGGIPIDTPQHFTAICPGCTSERQRAAEEHMALIGEQATFDGTRWGLGDRWLHHDIPQGSFGERARSR